MAAAFLLRMLFIAQAPALSYEAYGTVRHVEHIKDTGLPLFHDPLATDATTSITLPVFHYLLAFSTLFLPDHLVYIIVPNILAVLLHIALFYLVLELTNNNQLALIAAAASIFIPSYITITLLTASSLSLAIPLLIVLLTLFLKLRKTKEHRELLLFVFIILAFTHPIALLAIPFLIISVILATIRRSRDETIQQEFALFAIFFLLWLYILIYKKNLANIGIKTLFGNTPPQVLAAIYENITLPTLAAAVGIVPFGLALYAAYKEGVAHHIGIQATIALALSTILVLIIRIVPLTIGLAVFSVVCIALATVGLQRLFNYSKGLKRKALPLTVTAVLVTLFVFTSVLSTIIAGIQQTEQVPNESELAAAQWLKQNSPKNSLVLARPEQGQLIEAIAERPVYINTDYLSQEQAQERYQKAEDLLDNPQPGLAARKEHIEYIITTEEKKDPCLNTVYKNGTYIAKVLCR